MTTRIIDNSGADKIFVDFMYKSPKENLEEFRKGIKEKIVPRKLEVIEINPPQDGIAYIGKDFMHLSMSEGRGGFFDFERYWDKDGNPIGFGYKGQQYMFDKENLPERDRELGGQMTVNDSWAERVVSYLTGFLPKRKLETFRKNYSKEDVIEHNPPFNGIAYSCAYRCHTMVTKPIPNGRGEAKSSYADIVQYWDKDGNCIGFMFQGQKYMFDKEKLPEQGRDTIVQGFRDGQNRVRRIRIWDKDGRPRMVTINDMQREM